MVNKYFLFVSFFILSFRSLAQTDRPIGDLPVVIPPSPEVAEFARIGHTSSPLFTGASDVNIPLYDLTVGGIKVPIALTYSNNGIKVTDIPSRVGLGWNLVAGGSVSREIHGEADDESQFLTPPNFSNHDAALLNYLKLASKYGYDTEHDMYSFNAAGISGKFFFDQTGNPRLVSHSNLKIQAIRNSGVISSFIVTNAEGVQYFFGEGGKIEKTDEVVLNRQEKRFQAHNITWYLTRIVSPEGHTVEFNYNPIHIKTMRGQVQFVDLIPNNYDPNSTDPNCHYCEPVFGLIRNNSINYNSYYLTSIITSNGVTTNFGYQQRPDLSGDNRLTSLSVSAIGAYTLRNFSFEYLDVTHSDYERNKKFFLTKLTSSFASSTGTDSWTHSFEYVSPLSVPSQTSKSQDYYGYYNGASNSNLFPRISNYQNYQRGSEGGDRSPSAGYAQVGVLQKVTYPTGGYQQLFYEGHTVADQDVQTTYTSHHVGSDGLGRNSPKVTTEYFSSKKDDLLNIHFWVKMSPGAPTEGDPNYWPPEDGRRRIATLEFFKASTNTLILKKDIWGYGPTTHTLGITAGVLYQVKVTVYGSTNQAWVDFKYDPVTTQVATNKPGCGLRVSQIDFFDPVSSKVNSKYYKYASIAEPTKSSGIGSVGGAIPESIKGGFCVAGYVNGHTIWGQTLILCGSTLSVTSASPAVKPDFNGSSIVYKHVIESNDPGFKNGGIEHEFFVYDPAPAHALINGRIPNSPINEEGVLTGLERKILYFKRKGNNTILQKEVENNYNLRGLTFLMSSHSIRKRWEPTTESYMDYSTRISGWDVNVYNYSSGWPYLESNSTTIYDQEGENPVIEKTDYLYTNVAHTQPTSIKSTDSKGREQVSNMKYPSDYSTRVYQDMVNKHIISPVIEKEEIKAGLSLSKVLTDYKDWFGDGKVYRPEIIMNNKAGGAFENRIRYLSYDAAGNPLKISKESGLQLLYLWDYSKTYPVAEVRASSFDPQFHNEVAYTSFEDAESGFWEYAGSANQSISATGKMSYALSGGSLIRPSLNPAKTYVVSYWTKNVGAYSIAGTQSGYPIQGKSSGNWNYFEHRVTGQNSITISGAGYIDEVRLYPEGAEMSTYTYQPFVGMVSTADVRSNITTFEYDGLQRLITVRDQDNNILKKYCYSHAGKQLDCFSSPGTLYYYNNAYSKAFTKSCSSGIGSRVTYTVPVGKHSSTVSKDDANTMAQTDIAANGQTYANQQGLCVPPVTLVYTNSTNYPGTSYIRSLSVKNNTGLILYNFNTAALQAGPQIPQGTYTFEFDVVGPHYNGGTGGGWGSVTLTGGAEVYSVSGEAGLNIVNNVVLNNASQCTIDLIKYSEFY